MPAATGATKAFDNKLTAVRLLAAAAMALLCDPALADGMLDPAFGIGGQALFERGPLNGNVVWPLGGIAALADGAVQATMRSDSGDIIVLRLDAHGAPDAMFGNAGRVLLTTCAGTGDLAIATSADASALIWTGACVVKLTAAGIPDPEFAEQGFLHVGDAPREMAVDRTGRIVLAGTDTSGLFAHRYLADGHVDKSFGDGGQARLDFSEASDATVYALGVGADGAITAGGDHYASNMHSLLLARLHEDGTADAAFGAGGVVLLVAPEPNEFSWVESLLPTPDGGVLVGGPGSDGVQGCCAMLGRFDASGELVPEFGLRFFAPEGGPGGHRTYQVALLPQGRILLGLSAFHDPPKFEAREDFILWRLMPDGTPDASFGNDLGWRAYDMQDPTGIGLIHSYDVFHAMAVVDGRITLFGYTFFESSLAEYDYLSFARVLLDDVFADGFDGE